MAVTDVTSHHSVLSGVIDDTVGRGPSYPIVISPSYPLMMSLQPLMSDETAITGDDAHTTTMADVITTETVMTPSSHMPDFDDPEVAHGSKTASEILRAHLVLRACGIHFLVRHAEVLLDLSAKVIGTTITDAVVKATFFRHFCAGEDAEDMRPVITSLRARNVGAILDYAAECDGADDEKDGSGGVIFTQPPFNQPARVYDYKSEAECDRHVDIFRSCIRAVREVSAPSSSISEIGSGSGGFAALKVTALANPALLERMSTIIVEVKKLFAEFDEGKTGFINHDEFARCYSLHFHTTDAEITDLLNVLDPQNEGSVDYISFAEALTPQDLPRFTSACRSIDSLALATPSSDEIALMQRARERLHTLAEEATSCGVRLMIDAEQARYQPAIDSFVLELMRKFNDKDMTERPVVFQTYQCYLKDSGETMAADLRRSERFGFHFAAKLVRGAYMNSERERAQELGYDSPIHDTAQDTHRSYDDAIDHLLRERVRADGAHSGLEVVCATHNQRSVEKAVSLMGRLGLSPTGGKDEEKTTAVHFAQLYGMSDNLTNALGRHGYGAYKYLPYGTVREAMPYLVRRAQENGDLLKKDGPLMATELSLFRREFSRRVKRMIG